MIHESARPKKMHKQLAVALTVLVLFVIGGGVFLSDSLLRTELRQRSQAASDQKTPEQCKAEADKAANEAWAFCVNGHCGKANDSDPCLNPDGSDKYPEVKQYCENQGVAGKAYDEVMKSPACAGNTPNNPPPGGSNNPPPSGGGNGGGLTPDEKDCNAVANTAGTKAHNDCVGSPGQQDAGFYEKYCKDPAGIDADLCAKVNNPKIEDFEKDTICEKNHNESGAAWTEAMNVCKASNTPAAAPDYSNPDQAQADAFCKLLDAAKKTRVGPFINGTSCYLCNGIEKVESDGKPHWGSVQALSSCKLWLNSCAPVNTCVPKTYKLPEKLEAYMSSKYPTHVANSSCSVAEKTLVSCSTSSVPSVCCMRHTPLRDETLFIDKCREDAKAQHQKSGKTPSEAEALAAEECPIPPDWGQQTSFTPPGVGGPNTPGTQTSSFKGTFTVNSIPTGAQILQVMIYGVDTAGDVIDTKATETSATAYTWQMDAIKDGSYKISAEVKWKNAAGNYFIYRTDKLPVTIPTTTPMDFGGSIDEQRSAPDSNPPSSISGRIGITPVADGSLQNVEIFLTNTKTNSVISTDAIFDNAPYWLWSFPAVENGTKYNIHAIVHWRDKDGNNYYFRSPSTTITPPETGLITMTPITVTNAGSISDSNGSSKSAISGTVKLMNFPTNATVKDIQVSYADTQQISNKKTVTATRVDSATYSWTVDQLDSSKNYVFSAVVTWISSDGQTHYSSPPSGGANGIKPPISGHQIFVPIIANNSISGTVNITSTSGRTIKSVEVTYWESSNYTTRRTITATGPQYTWKTPDLDPLKSYLLRANVVWDDSLGTHYSEGRPDAGAGLKPPVSGKRLLVDLQINSIPIKGTLTLQNAQPTDKIENITIFEAASNGSKSTDYVQTTGGSKRDWAWTFYVKDNTTSKVLYAEVTVTHTGSSTPKTYRSTIKTFATGSTANSFLIVLPP